MQPLSAPAPLPPAPPPFGTRAALFSLWRRQAARPAPLPAQASAPMPMLATGGLPEDNFVFR